MLEKFLSAEAHFLSAGYFSWKASAALKTWCTTFFGWTGILQSSAPGTVQAGNCWKTHSASSRTTGVGCCPLECHVLCQRKHPQWPICVLSFCKSPCKSPAHSAVYPQAQQQGCHHFVRSWGCLWLETPLGTRKKPGQFTRWQEAKYIYLALNSDARSPLLPT